MPDTTRTYYQMEFCKRLLALPFDKKQFHCCLKFDYTMAAKDASISFDFWGTYNKIETSKIEYQYDLKGNIIYERLYSNKSTSTISRNKFLY
jgi:hypothetical protein